MTDTRRQALIVTIVLLLQTITLSSGKHHHKQHGQQCRTAWSSLQAHYSINQTALTAINTTVTHNTNATTAATNNVHQFNVSGIPWQYEGKPIDSIGAPQAQVVIVTPSVNQTIPAGQTAPKDGDVLGFPCLNAGVLLSCSKCDSILTGRDCYKKTAQEELDTESSGDIQCDLWYTRSGYGVGGGVTMCGTKAGDVFQCSSDQGLSQCEPCVELGTTSLS